MVVAHVVAVVVLLLLLLHLYSFYAKAVHVAINIVPPLTMGFPTHNHVMERCER